MEQIGGVRSNTSSRALPVARIAVDARGWLYSVAVLTAPAPRDTRPMHVGCLHDWGK